MQTVSSAAQSAVCVLVLALVGAAAAGAAAAPSRPLETAFVDPYTFTGPTAGVGLSRAAGAGATAIKVPLFWDTVAPAARPSRFRPAQPGDPAYNWTQVDAQLRLGVDMRRLGR